MKKKKLLAALLTAALFATTLLSACGTAGGDSTAAEDSSEAASKTADDGVADTASDAAGTHEPLTIMTSQGSDYSAFIEALQNAYPEIELEVISYKGYNTSEYNNILIQAGEIPDIYITTYPPADELQAENLIDLSGEDFVSNFNMTQLNNVSVDGAIYLLPANLSLFGIFYNQTLFEEQGWEVPGSLEELEALIPEIEAAGVTLSECGTQFTGGSFAYFFDVAAPDYFTTLNGIQWMNDFLGGNATAKENLEGAVATFERWIDDGMLCVGETPTSDKETRARFKEGNTAFLINNSSIDFHQNEDGTGDVYGIMPYLSVDGTNNIVITNVNNYIGISKAVEENPQKLADAMKVMAFVSTVEGQESLNTRSNTLTPLKNQTLSEDNPIYEISLLVDEGKSMELVYSGWEDYVVDIGEAVYDRIDGTIDGDELIARIDQIQADVLATGGAPVVAEVEEDLTKEQAAQIVGAAFAEATGADCALIPIGDYHDGKETMNGVNGRIFSSIALTENVISTFNPLGWSRTIQTMTLTGAQVKQYAEEGFFEEDDEIPFAYVLVTKDGEEINDATTYTVACVIEYGDRAAEGNLTDSGIAGQDALVEYLANLGTVNSETIVWK